MFIPLQNKLVHFSQFNSSSFESPLAKTNKQQFSIQYVTRKHQNALAVKCEFFNLFSPNNYDLQVQRLPRIWRVKTACKRFNWKINKKSFRVLHQNSSYPVYPAIMGTTFRCSLEIFELWTNSVNFVKSKHFKHWPDIRICIQRHRCCS